MRAETRTIHVGENVGPVDWSHPLAADKPAIWRDAERDPEASLAGTSREDLLTWKQRMRSALSQLAPPAEAPPVQLALFG